MIKNKKKINKLIYNKTEYIIYLRSKDADKKYNNLSSDCLFDLGNKLIKRRTDYFKISLISFVVPYSWTNINTRRNKLYYTESNLDNSNSYNLSLTIPNGNYDITELITYIKDQLNANTQHNIIYDITYDNVKNKITISITNQDKKIIFDFTQINTIYKMLGFDNLTYTLTYDFSLTSSKSINVYPDDVIYIRTNIISNNSYDTKTRDKSDILQKIDIKCNMNDFIFLENEITPILSNDEYIKEIRLKITDEDNNIIDLDGQEFTATLKIEETDNKNYLQDIKILLWNILNLKIKKEE